MEATEPTFLLRDGNADLVLDAQGALVSEEDVQRAQSAKLIFLDALLGETHRPVTTLSVPCYSSTIHGVIIIAAEVASTALGCWDTNEPLRFCVAGSPTEDTFFGLACGRLKRVPGIVFTKADRRGDIMLEVFIAGIRVSMSYHQSPYVKSWRELSQTNQIDLSSLGEEAKRRLRPYRDTVMLFARAEEFSPHFQPAYRAIKQWAYNAGLLSTEFMYLDEMALLSILAMSCKCYRPTTMTQCFLDFFTALVDIKADAEIFTDIPQGTKSDGTIGPHRAYKGTSRGLLIQSMSSPQTFVGNCRSNTAAAIIVESAKCIDQMTSTGCSYGDLLDEHAPFLIFLKTHLWYVRVDAAYWGASKVQGGRFYEWIHREVGAFAWTLDKDNVGLSQRPWPRRLQDRTEIDDDNVAPHHETHHESFYLIGLHHTRGGDHSETDSPFAGQGYANGIIRQKVDDCISAFEAKMTSDPLNDPTVSFISARILSVHYDETNCPTNDLTKWGPIPVDEAEIDNCADEDIPSLVKKTSLSRKPAAAAVKAKPPRSNKSTSHKAFSSSSSSSLTQAVMNSSLEDRPTTGTTTSLRPALDILHRLRFDPDTYDVDDYVIGHEDRHAGVMEMAVTSWKVSDSTTEDWIPQSRIVYYRRKGDGVEVWNRRTRVDRIFGTGVGDG